MLSIASNAASVSSRVRIGSKVFTTAPDHSRSCVAVAALGDAEHLRDHDERQREREVGDEVHLAGAARCDRVEVLVDELLRRAGAAPRSCAA